MGGIASHARSDPDAIAIASLRGQLSYGRLDLRQRALVAALRADRVGRGERIAVLSHNRPESLEVTTGALRAGIVPVPVNPLLTPPEVAYLLEDSGARWLFSDRTIDTVPTIEQVVTFGDAYERLLHDSDPDGAEIADVALGRPMHYTSGTTGVPKGVWVAPIPEPGAARLSAIFRKTWALQSDDVHLVCSPLAHSAPHRFALRSLEAGATVVLQERFDAEETLAAIDLFSVTTTFMVPTHLERILELGSHILGGRDVSTIRLLVHAGAPIREVTKRRAIESFPRGAVWEFYGSTEGQATRISSDEWLRKPGSVGTANPGAEISITDDRGRALPPREVGEVWIRDPDAERFEYWGDEPKTRGVWRDGAFTVGDLGWLDTDGYLFLSGRKYDTIITGGVNVYPQEVETTLHEHPSVADAMVYGAPNDEWGEEVRAAIVPAFGQPIDVEALRAWARERLAGFKVPRRVEIVDELPRTPTGKLKREAGPWSSTGSP